MAAPVCVPSGELACTAHVATPVERPVFLISTATASCWWSTARVPVTTAAKLAPLGPLPPESTT